MDEHLVVRVCIQYVIDVDSSVPGDSSPDETYPGSS